MTEKNSQPNTGKPNFDPTPKNIAPVDANVTGPRASKPSPRLNVSNHGGQAGFSLDYFDQELGRHLLMEALGTADSNFLDGFLRLLVGAGTWGAVANEEAINFMLAVVKGIDPKDQFEAMLAAQMAAVHIAIMTEGRVLNSEKYLPQQNSAERAFNKFARTFTSQMEALARYRSRGQQTVTVEHVTIHRGGQAIVGHVTQAGEKAARQDTEAPAALTDGRTSTAVPFEIEPKQAPAAAPVRRGGKQR